MQKASARCSSGPAETIKWLTQGKSLGPHYASCTSPQTPSILWAYRHLVEGTPASAIVFITLCDTPGSTPYPPQGERIREKNSRQRVFSSNANKSISASLNRLQISCTIWGCSRHPPNGLYPPWTAWPPCHLGNQGRRLPWWREDLQRSKWFICHDFCTLVHAPKAGLPSLRAPQRVDHHPSYHSAHQGSTVIDPTVEPGG